MKKIIALSACLAAGCQATEQMAFVFEIVRHGARAGFKEEFQDGFTVETGQLTAEGMRQRYLLGRYARDRYTNQYQLFDPDFKEGQVYVQSTDVNRTLQSGYSELMGIYPPGESAAFQLTTGEQSSLTSGRGMPPLNIRNASTINASLGNDALPDGFTSLPIYTFINPSLLDDLKYQACDYTDQTVKERRYDNANYNDYWWISNFVKDPLAEGLGVSPEIMDPATFQDVQEFADSYVARTFEGLSVADPNTFDNNTYYQMRTLQKILLTYMFSRDARRLSFSRVLSKPMEQMQNRVNELLGKEQIYEGFNIDDIRYAIYSAHDDQLANTVEWLHPTNAVQDYVKFAANVQFELMYDTECVAGANKSEDCFRTNVRWNGEDLAFVECKDSANSDGTGCSYSDFVTHMNNIWYDGADSDDLDKACSQEAKPYGQYDALNIFQ